MEPSFVPVAACEGSATHFGEVVSAKIYRFDPATDSAPRYETFEVPYEKDMRVLDVLDFVSENCGVGIGYRWFCGVKRCGMCGVTVNGKPALACWEKASSSMVIEPLPNMPVVRDLVVDRSALERATLAMEPSVKRDRPPEGFPEPVTHIDFAEAFKLMNCIECYVCTAACPVLADAEHREFAGPASLVQLAKVALHPKDTGDRVSLALKGDIYSCVSCYQCSNVCPVGINVLEDAIEKLKRRCAAQAPQSSDARHGRIFADHIRQFGRVHPPTLLRRVKGALQGISKFFMALAMFRKGKIQLQPQTVRSIEDIRKLFDAVERRR
ncbi:MAG: 4Fe-4S dicluster domain-containing protein [Hyphomicrobiales bacterium]|nr:4Fe-4S dicluster domain-containing protein [Hyphomicrobiales bacterium]